MKVQKVCLPKPIPNLGEAIPVPALAHTRLMLIARVLVVKLCVKYIIACIEYYRLTETAAALAYVYISRSVP